MSFFRSVLFDFVDTVADGKFANFDSFLCDYNTCLRSNIFNLQFDGTAVLGGSKEVELKIS